MANQNDKDTFLKSIVKADIVEIVKDIDDKIDALHTSSSKDFLFFNKLLKGCYQQVKDVSKASSDLSDKLIERLPQTSMEVVDSLISQRKTIESANASIHNLSNIMSEIYGTFSLITVPFNNYKQNIFTLKYVLANIKLHVSYIDIPDKKSFEDILISLNYVIESSIAKIEPFVNQQDSLATRLLELKKNISAIEYKGAININEQINLICRELKKMSEEGLGSGDAVNKISASSQVCFANMGEVITYLQYHDIIRQKMEHVQSAQRELVKGLGQIEGNGKSNTDEDLRFIAQIPKVTAMQVGQLLYTNKDYQSSIGKISNKLLGVSKETKKMTSLFQTIKHTISKFNEDYFNTVKEVHKDSSDYIGQIKTEAAELDCEFNGVLTEYKLVKEVYTQLFLDGKEIRNKIRHIDEWILGKGEGFSLELVKRLEQLSTGLHSSSNALKEHLNSITASSSKVEVLYNQIRKCLNSQGELSDAQMRLGGVLDGSVSICVEQTDLSASIYEEITSSMRNVEYYSFFKQKIEEIVLLLGDINNKIDIESIKKFFGSDNEVLSKMEDKYTMESERIIHEKLMRGDDLSNLIDDDLGKKDEDEDDLELF